MTTQIADRAQHARKRLDEAYGLPGRAFGRVSTVRITKGQPRGIKVEWGFYPSEAEVITTLGDLYDPENTILSRFTLWACGTTHEDALDAWMAHEGEEHTEYVDSDGCGCCASDEKELPYEVEQALIAAGETFESFCVPGNFAPCPTCTGHGSVLNDSTRSPAFTACPTCNRKATLNLDDPADLALYKSAIDDARDRIRTERAKAAAKAAKARRAATTTAKATWKSLPTRDAGMVNGYPVHTTVGCDYMKYANDPERRQQCTNDAAWFDPTTGLRVCISHKKSGPSRLP